MCGRKTPTISRRSAPATPRLFVIRHGGHDKFGRLGCGPEGLAARIAQTAEALRIIPGAVQTTAPPRQPRDDPPGASPAYFEASSQASDQIGEMAAAWERKTLAGFVEPYAPNVILEGPFGRYQGRKMVVDWARSLQDWNAPYAETDARCASRRWSARTRKRRTSSTPSTNFAGRSWASPSAADLQHDVAQLRRPVADRAREDQRRQAGHRGAVDLVVRSGEVEADAEPLALAAAGQHFVAQPAFPEQQQAGARLDGDERVRAASARPSSAAAADPRSGSRRRPAGTST